MDYRVTVADAQSQKKIPKSEAEKRRERIELYSLAFVLFCCLLIGKFENYTTYFSLAILGVLALNFKNDLFYIFLPIFLFFWDQFYLIPGSTPLYRVYTYMAAIRLVLDFKKLRFRTQFLMPFLVMIGYCLLVMSRENLRYALNISVDVIVSYFVISYVYQDSKLIRRMFTAFSLTAVCSGVYALLAESVVSYETGIGALKEIVRYYGTIGDANYAGYFYCVAMFMALLNDDLKMWYYRVPVTGALLYFLLSTGSQTALLCMVICACVYILLRYKLHGIPIVLLFLLAVVIFVILLFNIPALQKLGPLATIYNRLQETFFSAQYGDVNALTTNRLKLWQFALKRFQDESLIKKLIGGNVITTYIAEAYFVAGQCTAVHQSFIQGLLDFGVLGVTIIFGVRIIQTLTDTACYYFKKNKKFPEDIYCIMIITSVAFIVFAFTLDMFIDWRFMFTYYL